MNLIQRIRNLWRLSLIELSLDDIAVQNLNTAQKFDLFNHKPKMAQIIKRRDPVKEVLKNDQL